MALYDLVCEPDSSFASFSSDEAEHFEIIEQGLGCFLTSLAPVTPIFGNVNGVFWAEFRLGQWLRTIFGARLWVTAHATQPNLFDAYLTAGDLPERGKFELLWLAQTFDEVVGLTRCDWRA